MPFQVLEVAIQLVSALKSVQDKLTTRDPALADQLRRAASSVPLNIGEGAGRQGRDRTYHYTVAAGSARELVAALRIAELLDTLGSSDTAEPLALADRVLAMLWRLTH